MNLADLLISSADRDDSTGLTDEQQITRLTEFFAQVHASEPERFEPGQVVWMKCGASHPYRGAKAPHLFVGYLPKTIAAVDHVQEPGDLPGNAAALVFDCRVLVLTGGDESVSEHFSDSRNFTATRRSAA